MREKPWQCVECGNVESCRAIAKNCKFYKYQSCAGCESLSSCKVYNESCCIILINWTGVIFEELGGLQ
ncbi:MAG: hypothetical protein ACM3UU_08610 [Ignavibacteriales bacterium]